MNPRSVNGIITAAQVTLRVRRHSYVQEDRRSVKRVRHTEAVRREFDS